MRLFQLAILIPFMIANAAYAQQADPEEPGEPGVQEKVIKAKPAGKQNAATAQTIDAKAGVSVIDPVLRGFYFGLDAGIGVMPGAFDDIEYFPGADFGISIGGDIGDLLSIQAKLFFIGYGNNESSGTSTQDLMMLGGRLALLFSLWHTETVFLQAGAGGGIVFFDNAMDVPFEKSFTANVIVGFEYYTNLRHFSVGVDLDAQMILSPFKPNIQLLPHIRYTF